jgi:hypothetical protein
MGNAAKEEIGIAQPWMVMGKLAHVLVKEVIHNKAHLQKKRHAF